MSEICTGITIGPIVDTISLTSTPAGSWAASTLFSWVSREMLRELFIRGGLKSEDVIMPYVEWKDGKLHFPAFAEKAMEQGIGVLCDRIVLRGDQLENVRIARENVLRNLSQRLAEIDIGTEEDNDQWAKAYFRITAVKTEVPEGKNSVIALDEILNPAELEPVFVRREENSPILTLLANVSSDDEKTASDQNSKIRNSFLVQGTKDWALSSHGRNIRSIGNIAKGFEDGEKWASKKYYAVIAADGDNMGQIAKRLDTQEKIREFNKHFLDYTGKIALAIRGFDGLPIYSGGDDLLAIVPLYGYDPENSQIQRSVFDLMDYCSCIFRDSFKNEIQQIQQANEMLPEGKKAPLPTLSFGVSVQYYKSPLYEALSCARNEESNAKYSTNCKNAISFHLRTHSGHSHQLFIPMVDTAGKAALDALMAMARDGRAARTNEQPDGSFFFGTVYHLEEMKPLLQLVVEEYIKASDPEEKEQAAVKIGRLFRNIFDNESQQNAESHINDARELLIKTADAFLAEQQYSAKLNEEICAEQVTLRTIKALRIARFLSEKGDEEE